jgi:hypothetical protein
MAEGDAAPGWPHGQPIAEPEAMLSQQGAEHNFELHLGECHPYTAAHTSAKWHVFIGRILALQKAFGPKLARIWIESFVMMK